MTLQAAVKLISQANATSIRDAVSGRCKRARRNPGRMVTLKGMTDPREDLQTAIRVVEQAAFEAEKGVKWMLVGDHYEIMAV